MILVIGATGTVGREVVKQLQERGAEFKAMVRDLDKGHAALPGVKMVPGDCADPTSLIPAMADVNKVFLLTAADPNMVAWHKNVIDAAKADGVAHIVRLSALGADASAELNLAKWHGEADEYLENSKVPYTILLPHYFMDNFANFSGETIRTQKTVYAPMRDGAISMVAVKDIAAVAVTALVQDGHSNQRYALTGPEALDFDQAAQILSEEIGEEITYQDVPGEAAYQAMVDGGVPDWLADGLVKLYAYFATGQAAQVSPVVEKITGRPGTAFRQYVQDHLNAFKA
ncbi:MAG: SDR family oxidoreductase [Deltaproteobacteria bacterium]|nr:SDR family oxidoreductase [Deltaproteobacteria bacterium]